MSEKWEVGSGKWERIGNFREDLQFLGMAVIWVF
jgi:hypothetical protein